MSGGQRSKGIGFFAMVGGVMAGLKLKERWDDYRQLPPDEEGRVALNTTRLEGDIEENEGLLNTEIPAARGRRTRKPASCVCCGINCGLFWKAVGIVLGLVLVYQAFRLVKWAVTPSPTGLEDLPAYSTSLGCLDAAHLYNGSTIKYSMAVEKNTPHVLDLRGGAVGTVVVRKGETDDTDVRYEITIRSTDEGLFNQVAVHGDPFRNSLRVQTPVADINSHDCSRYDIVAYIPPVLQDFSIASHAVTHLLFDTEEADIILNKLVVTLFAPDTNNQILPHAGVHATNMKLEIFRGWIVGEVSIVENTSLKTQQGDGIVNVHASPMPYSSNESEFPTATLRTVTGSGRTDVRFSSNKGFARRRIEAHHLASRNGDMYLTYKDAEFNGQVSLKSKSYTATGLTALRAPGNSTDDDTWTHSVGDAGGKDELYVNTRGWTGLYF